MDNPLRVTQPPVQRPWRINMAAGRKCFRNGMVGQLLQSGYVAARRVCGFSEKAANGVVANAVTNFYLALVGAPANDKMRNVIFFRKLMTGGRAYMLPVGKHGPLLPFHNSLVANIWLGARKSSIRPVISALQQRLHYHHHGVKHGRSASCCALYRPMQARKKGACTWRITGSAFSHEPARPAITAAKVVFGPQPMSPS